MAQGRYILFSLVASVVYTVAYYFNIALFRYYPMMGEIHIGEQPASLGFSIFWYGWLATAVLIGVVVTALTPKRWAARLSADLIWVVPIVLIAAVLVYEKRWFI